jgi:hypothetical protein
MIGPVNWEGILQILAVIGSLVLVYLVVLYAIGRGEPK